MGFHQLPNLRMYWSSDGNLHVQRIADIMTIKRFLSILRLLHLNDNTAMPKKGSSNFDKLYKMRPFINHLMKQWWALKEEFPSLACSKSTYLLSFKVYEGKSNDTNYEGLLLGEKTVLQICEPFLDKGYCIYFDNFLSTQEKVIQKIYYLMTKI
jgi:hypothetical protein